MVNSHAEPVLQQVPLCDRASSLGKVDIGSQPLPNSSALSLVWNPQSDILRISSRKFVDATTRREMTSQFDPLGVVSPIALGGKLILRQVAASGVGWTKMCQKISEKSGKNGFLLLIHLKTMLLRVTTLWRESSLRVM